MSEHDKLTTQYWQALIRAQEPTDGQQQIANLNKNCDSGGSFHDGDLSDRLTCQHRCLAVQESFLSVILQECKRTLDVLEAQHQALGAAIVFKVDERVQPKTKKRALECNLGDYVTRVKSIEQSASLAVKALQGFTTCGTAQIIQSISEPSTDAKTESLPAPLRSLLVRSDGPSLRNSGQLDQAGPFEVTPQQAAMGPLISDSREAPTQAPTNFPEDVHKSKEVAAKVTLKSKSESQALQELAEEEQSSSDAFAEESESFQVPLKGKRKTDYKQLDKKGPNSSQQQFQATIEARRTRKTVAKKEKFINCAEDRTTAAQGYIRRYTRNKTTGRPNQVLVCLNCNAEKPKLTKMLRHLNVHKRDGSLRTDHEAAHTTTVQIGSPIRLPAFSNVMAPCRLPAAPNPQPPVEAPAVAHGLPALCISSTHAGAYQKGLNHLNV